MIVTYTATRSLISGHTLDTVYELDIGVMMRERPRPKVNPIKKRSTSLGGAPTTIIHRIEKLYDFSSIPLNNTQLDSLIEFLDSVVAGEPFTLDMTGVIDTPDNPLPAELINSYTKPASVTPPFELYSTSFKVQTI